MGAHGQAGGDRIMICSSVNTSVLLADMDVSSDSDPHSVNL